VLLVLIIASQVSHNFQIHVHAQATCTLVAKMYRDWIYLPNIVPLQDYCNCHETRNSKPLDPTPDMFLRH